MKNKSQPTDVYFAAFLTWQMPKTFSQYSWIQNHKENQIIEMAKVMKCMRNEKVCNTKVKMEW